MIDALPGVWGQVLYVVRLCLGLWALVGAVLAAIPPDSAYVAEGRGRKVVWVLVCAVSAPTIALLPLGFLSIIAVVATGVFYADVRPAVRGAR